jgi:hypothetical protein
MANGTDEVYWDNFLGENLACRFGDVAPGYEIPCFLVTRFHPSLFMIHALVFLHRARVQMKVVKQIQCRSNQTVKTVVASSAREPTRVELAKGFRRFRRRSQKQANFSLIVQVSINSMVSFGAYSISLYLGGPLAYSQQDVRGQVSDAFRKSDAACLLA